MNNDDVETVENCPKSLAAWKHEVENLRSQLEAERQRAERGEAAAGIIQNMYNERKTEESAADLYTRLLSTEETLIASTDLLSAAEAEIAALKAKLENPVVLPQRYVCEGYHLEPEPEGECYDRDGVIEAIQIAGFTVKGE